LGILIFGTISLAITMRTIKALAKRLRQRLQYALILTDAEYRGALGALIVALVFVIATALFAAVERMY
jgi:hypothetical protein